VPFRTIGRCSISWAGIGLKPVDRLQIANREGVIFRLTFPQARIILDSHRILHYSSYYQSLLAIYQMNT
jgi:hypothetical protein